jgi:hypothetical protein|tara:strand:+ start:1041 stop:1205 length:165 start_codon:yes stop_codon:yes gene_type:complete
MIRFITGLIVVMGCVGGLEQDTMTFGQFFIYAPIGIALMLWAMPKLIRQGEEQY